MTPFAMLGEMSKRAFPIAPQYKPGTVPLPEHELPPSGGGQPGDATYIHQPGVIDNFWGDMAVSAVPFVGSAYMANRAIGDFRNGNWGSGIGNSLFAAASLFPGVGALKGAFSALRGGAKALSGMSKIKNVASAAGKGYMTTGPLGTKGTLGVMGGGIAAPMLLDPAAPPQPAAPAPAQPVGFINQATQSIKDQGLSTRPMGPLGGGSATPHFR